MDKDQAIITQVAAKIAADLTISGKSVAEFAATFLDIKDVLFDVIYGQSAPAPQAAPQQYTPQQVEAQDVATVQRAFPQATEVAFAVAVAGKQHGDLPEWLIEACRRDGITKVYDNRDGLSANPKRPWFKAVDNKEKAYWPPRGK
jgi:hypothetical protein